jgi:hypothetical protein
VIRPRRCLLVAGVAFATCCSTGSATLAARSPVCTRGLVTVEVDPRGLLPLTTTNPIGAAAAAALRYEPPAARPQVTAVLFAPADRERGLQAKFSCGTRVWSRTVVVYILDRAMLPAQSASQRVYFVGRFRDGYRVWQVVH